MSIAPGLDEQKYREQQARNPDHELDSALDSSGPEKPDACDSCGRDVREGAEICETCAWVEENTSIDLGRRENGGEDPFDSFFEEAGDPFDEAMDSFFSDAGAREDGDVDVDALDPDLPDGYGDRGIWETSGQGDLFPGVGNDWRREWRGMPEYQHREETAAFELEVRFGDAEDRDPDGSLLDAPAGPEEDGDGAYGRNPNAIKVNFRSDEDRRAFAELMGMEVYELKDGIRVESREEFSETVGQNIRDSTQSIWYPEAEIRRMSNKEYRVPPNVWTGRERHQPKYPIYVPSKGRYDNCYTPDVLDELGIRHKIVVEPDEVDQYAERFGSDRLIVLPEDLEPGLHTTRTWIKRHCRATTDADRHWQMDDNIQGFYRYNDNLKTPCADGTVIRCMEDFVDRYENVALAGPRYFMFVTRKSPMPPLTLNTRVYSCTLVNNSIPHEWELRYNDDTDISLRVLKDGWTTVIFNAFLQYKTPTMELSGGLTEDYEAMDDRREFAEMLREAHPELVKVTKKFGRVHHHVDYGPFKGNELEPRDRSRIEGMPRVDNRGMVLYVDGEPLTANPARTGAIR